MRKHIRHLSLLTAAIMLLGAFLACSGATGSESTPAPVNTQDVITTPNGSSITAGIRKAVGGSFDPTKAPDADFIKANNDFTAALMDALGDDWTGVVSPVSFCVMLEMLLNGADEKTAEEICAALKLDLDRDGVNENAAALIKALAALRSGENDSVFTFDSSILVSTGDSFAKDFESRLASNYDASVGNIDFTNSDEALRLINGWVKERTNGLIEKLFDEITPDTTMALINALYFKGNWSTPFALYEDGFEWCGTPYVFMGKNGVQTRSIITSTGLYGYGSFDSGEMVVVPYADGEYSMAFVLPKDGFTPAGALAEMCRNGYAGYLTGACNNDQKRAGSFKGYESVSVKLMIPKIKLDTKLDCMQLLPSLGLGGIADGTSLFPGIVEGAPIRITQFVHAASLSVDENGTEAAAATGVTGTKSAAPIAPEYVVDFNRSYAMAIVHNATGAVVFASVVNDLPGA